MKTSPEGFHVNPRPYCRFYNTRDHVTLCRIVNGYKLLVFFFVNDFIEVFNSLLTNPKGPLNFPYDCQLDVCDLLTKV